VKVLGAETPQQAAAAWQDLFFAMLCSTEFMHNR
jgi:hypothetical protein